MVVDINKYVLSKEFVQNYLKKNTAFDTRGAISMISATSGVPVIVCAFYAGEIFGWTDEILGAIRSLRDSYGYTDIINMPEDFPKERL